MQICKTCVLPDTYPGISFDREGICNYCREYAAREKQEIHRHFNNEEELMGCLQKYKNLGRDYDVLVPLSGGVDSSFALILMVEKFGLKPLVFHNDHGYEQEVASRNAESLCKELDVDLIIWKRDFLFMKKLFKYFNESDDVDLSPCFVCGNMLYLNGLQLADQFNIPLVVNGYSKGQAEMMHDTERSRELYGKMIEVILETGDREFFDQFNKKWELLDKQIIYKSKQDLEKEVDTDRILFIPLFVFKFYKTHKEELQKICRERFNWQPLEVGYPARTTNCRMIWLNSYMDLKKRHYTHYHDEYSTLIRAGEISREQVLKDLELNPPGGLLERLAEEIGIKDLL